MIRHTGEAGAQFPGEFRSKKKMGINLDKEDIAKVAGPLGMGFYRVKESGEFLEADLIARELFGIPKEETDLSSHSIESLYIFPAERKLRISQMANTGNKPTNGNLSLRINGETRFLFDQCWCDGNEDGERCFAGLVTTIEDRVIFPKMFDKFPIGVYELDDENKIVRFNEEALKIFG
jgi:PAS domain-containing protein